MIHRYMSLVMLSLLVIVLSPGAIAQEISIHPANPGWVWFEDVEPGKPLVPISCETGGSRYYRLHVESSSLNRGFLTDTISTNKKELTAEDISALEADANAAHQSMLNDLLEEQAQEFFNDHEYSLMDDLADLCENEFDALLESWAEEDYPLCLDDCKSEVDDCNFYYMNQSIRNASIGYRLKYNYHFHPAARDDEAEPPYEVEIYYDLELYKEAWVYFEAGCECLSDGTVSIRPDPDSPWNDLTLTGGSMKPFITPVNQTGSSFPLLPVLGGVVGVGGLTYILLRDDGDPIECSFSVFSHVTPAVCALPNGTATLTTSPPGDYQFLWFNGATGSMIQNLLPGTYTVTVSLPGTTCSTTLSINIANTNTLIDATITTQQADCGETNGSATVIVSPIGNYTFQWSNGSTQQNQTGLPPGTYTLNIQGAGECMQTYQVTIGELPFDPDIEITATSSGCGLSDGTATAFVQPPGEYIYTWSNGQTGPEATGLGAGNYTVSVSVQGSSCLKTANVDVDENPANHVVTVSTTPSGCGLSDGTATATVDPSGDYTYVWSNGQTGPEATGLGSGQYSLSVTLAGSNCEQEVTFTVDELPPSHIVTVSTTPSGCGLTDGTATAIVDPPGEYTYIWSNGQTGPDATELEAGQYSVSVSVAESTCEQVVSFTVDELPATHTITVSTTPTDCGLADGTATATVDPPGEYTYLWSNGQTGPEATGLVAGEHSVSVSVPGSTCLQSVVFVVDETASGHSVTVSTTPTDCGLAEGTATATVDPPGEYTYNWSNGQSGPEATGLAGGEHSVSVSVPGSTCVETVTFIIDEIPASHVVTVSTTPAGCGLTNGTATATVDPPGDYDYSWSNGQTGPEATELGAGEYQVTVSPAGTTCEVVVTLMVDQTGGGFTASFVTTNSDCGQSNGTAIVTIDPAGDYTYAWSNDQSGSTLQDVMSGSYMLTVADANNCTETFSVEVGENPASFISIGTIIPGNCLFGGNISFTLSTPGAGPLQVDVSGPTGNVSVSLAPGSYNLSSFTVVTSGSYTFSVFDQSTGPDCTEITNVTVPDNTPPFQLMDDIYFTTSDNPVAENALVNDSGFNITMTAVSDIFGGTVSFNAIGDFIYTPNPGFSGDGSFVYTVTDACGTTGTALVTIIVEPVACDFTVTFETTPASCGLADGAITVFVNEPGTYSYSWSNGSSGSTITNVPAGTYTVTIMDLNLGCDLNFVVQLQENPADHISDIIITQPTCGSSAEIQFTASTTSGNPLLMQIFHPNGSNLFFIQPGMVFLSDYVSITPGGYTIEIRDAGAGPDCTDSFSATINPPSGAIEIFAEAILPPSEPSAMDGVALIGTIVQGELPYEILLNGSVIGLALDHFFEVGGLGVGPHTIQVIDALGCASNVLNIFVPFPDIILSFGTGVQPTFLPAHAEPTAPGARQEWRNTLLVTIQYPAQKFGYETRLTMASPFAGRDKADQGWVEAEQLASLKPIRYKGFSLQSQVGLGARHLWGTDSGTSSNPFQTFWTAGATAQYNWDRIGRIEGRLMMRGWYKVQPPVLTLHFIHSLSGNPTIRQGLVSKVFSP